MRDPEVSDARTGPPAEGPSWLSRLRNLGLIAALLALLWMAFNVRLPSVEELQATIDQLGWIGWIAFVGLYALVAVTPVPVTVMAVTGGLLFGVVAGSLLSVIGVLIGCWAAYWIARGLGRSAVSRLLGRHRGLVEGRLQDAGFPAVCTLRLMPGVPYWPVNYGSGAFGVGHRDYLVASVLSVIPGQVSLVALGAFTSEPTVLGGLTVALAWTVVVALTIVSYRRWRPERRHVDA